MLQLDGEPGVPKVPHLLHALTRRSGYRDADWPQWYQVGIL
jgi:hypothetical protein